MEPRRDDFDLATELRALRPTPRAEFASELDARAAAGFPPQTGPPRHRQLGAALAGIAERLRATPARRVLAPAGALAMTAIVIATAVVATSEDGTTSKDLNTPLSSSTPGQGPSNGSPQADRSSQGSSGIQYSEVPPVKPDELAAEATRPGHGPYASQTDRREIERSAQIVLGADPADVRADAAKVFDVVHAADGIVLRSSIRDGAAGEAGAEFELLIPGGKLGDALADFSTIGEVRSRRESTRDITAPTIGAREHLQDAQAKIEGLLVQLASAETDGERAAVEVELRAERRRAAVLRSRLATLSRRANLSRVSLRIETGAAAIGEDDGGAWGIGDGLDDAGRILEIAAGVTIVGLAILAPLALIAFLAWLAHRAWVRARRQQALR